MGDFTLNFRLKRDEERSVASFFPENQLDKDFDIFPILIFDCR